MSLDAIAAPTQRERIRSWLLKNPGLGAELVWLLGLVTSNTDPGPKRTMLEAISQHVIAEACAIRGIPTLQLAAEVDVLLDEKSEPSPEVESFFLAVFTQPIH